MKPLLDTHILIHWIAGSAPLLKAHRKLIQAANDEKPLWVSDITLWEVATLFSLGRIELDLPLRDWLERATAPPLVRRLAITRGSGRGGFPSRHLPSRSGGSNHRRHGTSYGSNDPHQERPHPRFRVGTGRLSSSGSPGILVNPNDSD